MSENPWLPPTVREDGEPATSLWRLFFGWIATGLSITFAGSCVVFLAMGQFCVIPTSLLLSAALWRIGSNLRLNRPVP